MPSFFMREMRVERLIPMQAAAQEYEPVAEPWRSTMGSSSIIGDLNQHRLLGGDTRRRAVR